MANLVVSNRVAPWIGVGTSGQWTCSHDALAASQLDFTVRQEDLYWQHVEPSGIVYDEKVPMHANIRNTDDHLLGCVTPQYRVMQNDVAFSIIDPFLANGGIITHAGMTADGLCFMVAEVSAKKFGGEDYQFYLMVTNSFNAKYPCQIIMTPVRIICQNMYRKLMPDKVFLAKHTATANDRIKYIANSNVVDKKIALFGDIVDQAQSRKMDRAKLEMLVAMMFPYPKENGPRELTFKAKADAARQEFLDRYYDASDNVIHHGTAFGFVNAYYDWLSHRDAPRSSNVAWEDRRLQGLVSGDDINMALVKEVMK